MRIRGKIDLKIRKLIKKYHYYTAKRRELGGEGFTRQDEIQFAIVRHQLDSLEMIQAYGSKYPPDPPYLVKAEKLAADLKALYLEVHPDKTSEDYDAEVQKFIKEKRDAAANE